MTERYRLGLLGLPQVTREGQPVQGFESRKALALLCYLAARQESLPRAQLADLFWRDKSEAKGRANLSGVIHNLTTLLPNSIRADRHTVELELDAFWLDLRAYEEHTKTGAAEALAEAGALYRDEFLAGLYLDDCPDFEVWVVAEREHWRQRQASVLECVAGTWLRRGDYARALNFTARLLDLEPWHEESHRQMMELLAHTGQRSAALQQFEICRRVLTDELGVEPAAETIALNARIRSEEVSPALRAVPKNSLPTPLTTFVGRETEVARITARLHNPECRLLTLIGTGGSGKTRLALQVAGGLPGSFRDGIYFVPLAALNSPEWIVSEIAKACEFTFAGATDPKTQLLNYLREKQMLLIIDNWEHLLTGAGIASEILQAAPGTKILATSREPLNLQAEWLTRVQGLSYPFVEWNGPGSGSVRRYHAIQLFAERAQRADESFALTPETTASVVHICQVVEGLPLALELAAAAARDLPVWEIAKQIASNLDLRIRLKDIEPRHQSLRSVLDWSHALLSDSEKAFFRRLAVFAGGWSPEAAEEVCAGPGMERGVAEPLARLVDKSLVILDKRESDARYRLLEPIRQYAHEKLVEAGEGETASKRHLDFFLCLAEMAEPKLNGLEQTTWLRRLDSEHANLRAAIAWARDSGAVEESLRLTIALRWFWEWRGYWNEGSESLGEALAQAQPSNQTPTMQGLRARALLALGSFVYQLGASQSGEHLLNEAITLAESLGDQGIIAEAFLHHGINAYNAGQHSQGHAHIEASLALSRETGNARLTAWALQQRGYYNMLYADLNLAEADFHESLRLFRSIGHQLGIAAVLSMQSLVTLHQGDYAATRALNEESLSIAREIGGKRQISIALQRLGQALVHEGEYTKAEAVFDQTLALRRELGERISIPHILTRISNLKRLAGDEAAARALAEEGLRGAREVGFRLAEAHALAALGKVALAQGDYAEARAWLEQAYLLRQEIRNKLDMPAALCDLGDVAFCEGDFSLAKDYYDQTVAISRRMGSRINMPGALRMLGYITLYEGDIKTASQRFSEGLGLVQRSFRPGIIYHLPALAALALARGQVTHAARLLAATDALLGAVRVRLEPAEAVAKERSLSAVRAQLDTAALEEASREGEAMTWHQAIDYALEEHKGDTRASQSGSMAISAAKVR